MIFTKFNISCFIIVYLRVLEKGVNGIVFRNGSEKGKVQVGGW